jgi:hypothetical protein
MNAKTFLTIGAIPADPHTALNAQFFGSALIRIAV